MKVKMHRLFEYLLETTGAAPEAVIGFSLSPPPRLGSFLDGLDPDMSLDWNGQSFLGLPALRQSVLRFTGLGETCGPDDVLITAGAAEANYLVLRQVLEEGDRVVADSPGWPQVEVLAKAIGARLTRVPRDEAAGWALDPARLAEAVQPGTKLVFLSNPNNPTGRCFTRAELDSVVAIARNVGAWLLIDEVYAGLEWEAERQPPVAALYEKGITTGSLSKVLGLQGLRTGWLICRDAALVMDAVVLRENSSEIMNVMGETLAELALRPDRLDPALAAARQAGRVNLDRMDAFVAETEGLDWHRPQAGLIGLGRLPEGLDGEDFARRLLGPPWRTFVMPGAAYGLPGHIRLGVGGGPAARLDIGLERLADCLATVRAERGETASSD